VKLYKIILILGLMLFVNCDISEPVYLDGCTDSIAKNYNQEATDDDGSCYYGEVLFINEFLASNDSGFQDADDLGEDPFDDWVELYNPTNEDIDLAGMFFADGNEVLHKIPSGGVETIVPANEFVIVWFDDELEDGLLHIPEKLSSGGDAIYLFNTDSLTVVDSYEFSEQYSDISMARSIMENPIDIFFSDNKDNWELTLSPTPGNENVIEAPVFGCTDSEASNYDFNADLNDGSCLYERVFINEIYENGAWIELYNNTSETVDIAGWYVQLDGNSWQIPVDANSTEISASGFLVLYADEDDEFPHLGEDLVLNSYGGNVAIYESDEITLVDMVEYDEQNDEFSWGRFPDGTDIWKFTTPTLGAINEYSPEVVLNGILFVNEILASNDFTNSDEFEGFDDWIEIYNSGIVAIDIGGMYISDDLTNVANYQIPETNPELTTIQPGGYLIIWCDKEPDQGVLHADIKLSGTGEDAVLTDKDGTTIIDYYTFGEQTTDISIGRSPDGTENWIEFTSPTPGATNN
jgi:hypothetical protein